MMSPLEVRLLWGLAQMTLFAAVGAAAYACLPRRAAELRATLLLGTMLLALPVTAAIVAGWPSWSLLTWSPVVRAEAAGEISLDSAASEGAVRADERAWPVQHEAAPAEVGEVRVDRPPVVHESAAANEDDAADDVDPVSDAETLVEREAVTAADAPAWPEAAGTPLAPADEAMADRSSDELPPVARDLPSAAAVEHDVSVAHEPFTMPMAAASQPGVESTLAPLWRAWARYWPVVALALAALAMLAGAAQLLIGLWLVDRLRRRARPIDDAELIGLIGRLARELGCPRAVAVRESREVATAATVGWRHPLVLLAEDWRQWNRAELESLVAHELAHVSRGDYLSNLLAQASRAVHFYHPLWHWLVLRLRAEQELAADARAAAATVGIAEYARTLARMALAADRPVAWPVRSFLPNRRALIRRIEMLRSRENLLPTAPRGTKTVGRVLALAALALVALLTAGLQPGGGSELAGGGVTAAADLQTDAPNTTAGDPFADNAFQGDGETPNRSDPFADDAADSAAADGDPFADDAADSAAADGDPFADDAADSAAADGDPFADQPEFSLSGTSTYDATVVEPAPTPQSSPIEPLTLVPPDAELMLALRPTALLEPADLKVLDVLLDLSREIPRGASLSERLALITYIKRADAPRAGAGSSLVFDVNVFTAREATDWPDLLKSIGVPESTRQLNGQPVYEAPWIRNAGAVVVDERRLLVAPLPLLESASAALERPPEEYHWAEAWHRVRQRPLVFYMAPSTAVPALQNMAGGQLPAGNVQMVAPLWTDLTGIIGSLELRREGLSVEIPALEQTTNAAAERRPGFTVELSLEYASAEAATRGGNTLQALLLLARNSADQIEAQVPQLLRLSTNTATGLRVALAARELLASARAEQEGQSVRLTARTELPMSTLLDVMNSLVRSGSLIPAAAVPPTATYPATGPYQQTPSPLRAIPDTVAPALPTPLQPIPVPQSAPVRPAPPYTPDTTRREKMYIPPSDAAQSALLRQQSQLNLKRIGLALHNYHDVHGRFPPQASVDAEGRPLLSWRVLLLPFLEENTGPLYRDFRLDEPWDSLHNRNLIARMPSVYRFPDPNFEGVYETAYAAISGPQAGFDGHRKIRMHDITDGTSNTIAIVETAARIPWTKPDDLLLGDEGVQPGPGGLLKDGFNALLFDGSVRFIGQGVDGALLRSLMTIGGGERIELP